MTVQNRQTYLLVKMSLVNLDRVMIINNKPTNQQNNHPANKKTPPTLERTQQEKHFFSQNYATELV